jgi:predicted anti-sigma-YlaC factor YlaD
MAMDRLRHWLSMVDTTQPEEMDCDTLFEMLEVVVEATTAGQDIAELFPAVALHLTHCPSCQDLYDTLIALTTGSTT